MKLLIRTVIMTYYSKTVIAIFIFFVSFTQIFASNAEFWGRTGHFITGEIAQKYLDPEVAQIVNEILAESSWNDATVWMDQVRSMEEYSHTRDWHWVTIHTGETYEESEKNPNGDVVGMLEVQIERLKSGELTRDEERDALRFVIHMIGDMHQPLHVGTGDDRGGNDVRVTWMGRNSNLHRVWDTDLLESWGMEPYAFANAINLVSEEQARAWQQSTVRDWAHESMQYRDSIYDLPEDLALGWEYRNRNFHIIEKRLLQAGIRIAGVLNEIYGGR